jgi:hypothetical protein
MRWGRQMLELLPDAQGGEREKSRVTLHRAPAWQRGLLASAIVWLALSAAGCSDSADPSPPESATGETHRRFSPVAGANTPLLLRIRASGTADRPIISGDTNFPDGTKLYVGVTQNAFYMSDSPAVVVSNGGFTTIPLQPGGKPLVPGSYTIEISSPSADDQPPDVQALVGPDYRNLTGSGFGDAGLGRVLKLSWPYTVPAGGGSR